MLKVFSNSLNMRAWLAEFIIISLIVFSILSSGYLSWIADEDAEAINIAGSLRMATYRISFVMATQPTQLYGTSNSPTNLLEAEQIQPVNELIKDMDARLVLLKNYQNYKANKNSDIDSKLNQISDKWHNQLKPLLENTDSEAFFMNSAPYVDQVDNFVNQLQYRNEQRLSFHKKIQLFMLFVTLLVIWRSIHVLRKQVLRPVKNLVKAKQAFTAGELGTRIKLEGYSEFKMLGESFNSMAQTIEANHQYLEDKVNQKTESLTQANQVLSLLYDFAKHLTTHQISVSDLNQLIDNFSEIIPELEFTLCLQSHLIDDKDSIAIHSDQLKELCSTTTCENCAIKADKHTKTYPVRQQDNQYGELRVRPEYLGLQRPIQSEANNQNTDKPLNNGQINKSYNHSSHDRIKLVNEDKITDQHLKQIIAQNNDAITALANLIGTAMYFVQHRQQEHQIILLEERATIARELHDSLAQSLSYLKIQVSILERRLHQSHCQDPNLELITDSIGNIKLGLTSAYQQLRDLLVTFRLSLNEDSFDEAIHNSADEFSKKGNFTVNIYNQVMTLNLSAAEQVNMIQIIREALSNINRHSKADSVDIHLQYVLITSEVKLSIRDNGVGITKSFDQTHHHGLMIMQERAKSLGGDLSITNNSPHGTVIETQFLPEFLVNNSTEE